MPVGSALLAYARDLATSDLAAAVRRELAGRDLACWCRPSDPCHADVLLFLVAERQLVEAGGHNRRR